MIESNTAGNTITPKRLFLFVLVCLIVITVVWMPLSDGTEFYGMLHADPLDTFMDLFNSIHDSRFDDPYTARGVIYPPLTYMYYRLCGSILPDADKGEEPWYARQIALDWRNSQSGIFLALATTVVSYILLIFALLPPEKRNDIAARRLTCLVVLGTVPFWYAVERGNLILLTLAFLAYFVTNYKSESKVRRELALICLGVATAFKIYPAIFGLLLLREKKFFAAGRCVIYGLVLLFMPFVLFGGFDSVGVLIGNIMNTNEHMTTYGMGYKVDLGNTISFVSACLHRPIGGQTVIKCFFLVVLLVVFVLTKKEWQRYMSLCVAMIIFPGFSYTYTLVFAAIPLLIFLKENPRTTTRNLLYALLFLGMFAPLPFGGKKLFENEPKYLYQLNLTTIVSSFSILVFTVLMAVDTVICRIRHEHENEMTQAEVRKSVIWFCAIALIFAACVTVFCVYSNYLFNLDVMPI